MIVAIEEIYPEKANLYKNIKLFAITVVWRVDDNVENISTQLSDKKLYFSLTLNKLTEKRVLLLKSFLTFIAFTAWPLEIYVFKPVKNSIQKNNLQ